MSTWLLTNRWLLRAIWLPWILLPLPPSEAGDHSRHLGAAIIEAAARD